MAAPNTTDLSPHYYLHNFLRLCGSVREQYTDLLLPDEIEFLTRLQALPFDAQCLYVRLISRVGPWFRESRLSYSEIGSVEIALNDLVEQGFACEAAELSAVEAGALFTVGELRRALAQVPGLPTSGSKAVFLEALEGSTLSGTKLLEELATIDGRRIVGPLHLQQIDLLHLLFFGNRYQSMTDFLLQDLGIVTYYPYALDADTRMFPCRESLDEYLQLAALADRHHELLEQDAAQQLPELARSVLPLSPAFDSSRRRWDKLCNNLARDLERQGELELALALYLRSDRHPARERSARILEQQGKLGAAREQCLRIQREPWCEAEQDAAQRILPRVQRKLDGTPNRRRREQFDELHIALEQSDGPVELACAGKLLNQWEEVRFVENSLMNALFGLAFWEQIFAPLPGAFTHPYQGVPADMYERDFGERRAAMLSRRRRELAGGDLAALLGAAYRRYCPCHCHWVNWKFIDEQLVEKAASTIPAPQLLAIWERILFDPRENRSGFPDLIAFGEAPGQYAMIEVKGPGDALQDSQKRWLRFFREQAIPAQVAWVSWQHD